MSVAESFFNVGKQFLLATENLKRVDQKMARMTDDIHGINMRLVRVETLISVEGPSLRTSRVRKPHTLPGESA